MFYGGMWCSMVGMWGVDMPIRLMSTESGVENQIKQIRNLTNFLQTALNRRYSKVYQTKI